MKKKATVIVIVIVLIAAIYILAYFHDVDKDKQEAMENLKLEEKYNISSIADAKLIEKVEENKSNGPSISYKDDRNFEAISNIYYANEGSIPENITKYYKKLNKDSKHIEWVRYKYKNGLIDRDNFTAEINYYANKNPLNHYLLNYYVFYEPMSFWSPF